MSPANKTPLEKHPRSVRHKQVLEKAAEKPDASIEELASMVPSATADLVERVLDEHGDPAEQDEDSSSESSSASEDAQTADQDQPDDTRDTPDIDVSSNGTSATDVAGVTSRETSDEDVSASATTDEYPAPEELTAKQRETLRLIAEFQDATQAELAEKLDVSAPTVSNRVNSIDQFEWSERMTFIETVLDCTSNETSTTARPETDVESEIAECEKRLAAIEQHLEQLDDTESCSAPFDDMKLTHKIIHACIDAENISEEEELRILEGLFQ